MAQCLLFCSSSDLLVGYSKEYNILSLTTGKKDDEMNVKPGKNGIAKAVLLSEEMMLVNDRTLSFSFSLFFFFYSFLICRCWCDSGTKWKAYS